MAGYLGATPVPQATQHRESFTATSGQTTFNTAGYTAGFVDVYLNGSHLSPADFTATNGSDVVLASGASADDVCDIISHSAFELNAQTFTGTTTMDVAAITGVLTTTAATVFNGGFAANAASTITTADNLTGLTVASTDADAGVGPTIQLFRNSSSPADNDLAGNLLFVAENDASEATVYANIGAHLQDVTNGTEDGKFFINTIVAGAEKSRMFMPSTETVFNEESIDLDFRVETNGQANMFFIDGGSDYVAIGSPDQNNGGLLNLNAVSASTVLTMTTRSATDGHTNIITMLKTPATSGNYTATASGDILGDIRFMGINTSAVADIGARIVVEQTGTASGTVPAQMSFITNEATAMTINSAQEIGINTAPIGTVALTVQADGSNHAAILKSVSAGFAASIVDNTASSGTRNLTSFRVNNVVKGSITSDGSSTAYNESSDYRLKENVDYTWDATTRLKQLKPVRFDWIGNAEAGTRDGFLAHEVSSVVPNAVTGEKDAVMDDGTIDVQNIDQSKLVPLLVKTIQELEARITALENA